MQNQEIIVGSLVKHKILVDFPTMKVVEILKAADQPTKANTTSMQGDTVVVYMGLKVSDLQLVYSNVHNEKPHDDHNDSIRGLVWMFEKMMAAKGKKQDNKTPLHLKLLEQHISKRVDVSWILKLRTAVEEEKMAIVQKSDSYYASRVINEYASFNEDQLNALLIKINGAIDKILDDISLDELKTII